MNNLMRKIGKCIPFVRQIIQKDEKIERLEPEVIEAVIEVMKGDDEALKRKVTGKIQEHLDAARGAKRKLTEA